MFPFIPPRSEFRDFWFGKLLGCRIVILICVLLVQKLAIVPLLHSAENETPRVSAGTNQAATMTNSSVLVATTNSPTVFGNREPMDDKIRIGIGDRLSFRVLEDQEESRPLLVTDSGDIDVPYVGRVVAKDKTCQELAGFIRSKLEEDYYFQATVVLSLEQFNRSRGKIYISGAVRLPGAVDIPSDEIFTVSKAILRVGGFNEFADKKKVRIMRKNETNSVSAGAGLFLDVGAIIEEGRAENDLKLESGDLIFVQSKLFKF